MAVAEEKDYRDWHLFIKPKAWQALHRSPYPVLTWHIPISAFYKYGCFHMHTGGKHSTPPSSVPWGSKRGPCCYNKPSRSAIEESKIAKTQAYDTGLRDAFSSRCNKKQQKRNRQSLRCSKISRQDIWHRYEWEKGCKDKIDIMKRVQKQRLCSSSAIAQTTDIGFNLTSRLQNMSRQHRCLIRVLCWKISEVANHSNGLSRIRIRLLPIVCFGLMCLEVFKNVSYQRDSGFDMKPDSRVSRLEC